MLERIGHKMLWNFAWRLGYAIKEIEVEPIKTHGQDIRELPYLTDLPYTTFNLPTELGVGLGLFPLKDIRIYHPFVLALKQASQENQKEDIFKLLKKYSNLISFRTPNDIVGFEADEDFFPKHDHPYCFTYPWSPLEPFEMRERKIAYNVKENKRFGLKTQDSLDLAGTSDEKVRIETIRLSKIYNQIKTHGFKPQYPDSLGGFVLKQENNYKWFVQGGQHRAAVLAVLGYEEIPVHVRQIIRREEVASWPNVLSGLFSQEKALMVFDKMFKAELSPVTRTWVDHVDKTYPHLACTCQR